MNYFEINNKQMKKQKIQQLEKLEKGGVNMAVLDQRYRSQIEGFLKEAFTMDQFYLLLEAINSDCILRQHWGIIGICKLLSMREDKNIDDFVGVGIADKLVIMARNEQYPQMQYQAVCALVSLTSGTRSQCLAVVQAGGIPLLIQLLKGANQKMSQRAIVGLGNIAIDFTQYRDLIIAQGGIDSLIKYLNNSNNDAYFSNACWALSNLCFGFPLPHYETICNGISVLCKVLAEGKILDQKMIYYCCWAISFHCCGTQKRRIIKQSGVIPRLVQNIEIFQGALLVPLIRIICDAYTNNQSKILELIRLNIIKCIQKGMKSVDQDVRYQTYHLLANLARCKNRQIQALLQNRQICQVALKQFENEQEAILFQIIWCFSNFTSYGHSGQLYEIISPYNIIERITKFLSTKLNEFSLKQLRRSLNDFNKILLFFTKYFRRKKNNRSYRQEFKEAGGKELLDLLKSNEQQEILSLAYLIQNTTE